MSGRHASFVLRYFAGPGEVAGVIGTASRAGERDGLFALVCRCLRLGCRCRHGLAGWRDIIDPGEGHGQCRQQAECHEQCQRPLVPKLRWRCFGRMSSGGIWSPAVLVTGVETVSLRLTLLLPPSRSGCNLLMDDARHWAPWTLPQNCAPGRAPTCRPTAP